MVDPKSGVRYRVIHERAYGPKQNEQGDYLRSEKGGRTVVEILGEYDQVLATGESVARPDENYNRKLGRTIAFGRALKAYRESQASTEQEPVEQSLSTLAEFADLMRLAMREADQDGVCFIHLDGKEARYVLATTERYRSIVLRAFGEGGVATDDPEWQHSHVEPEMVRDPAVVGTG